MFRQGVGTVGQGSLPGTGTTSSRGGQCGFRVGRKLRDDRLKREISVNSRKTGRSYLLVLIRVPFLSY